MDSSSKKQNRVSKTQFWYLKNDRPEEQEEQSDEEEQRNDLTKNRDKHWVNKDERSDEEQEQSDWTLGGLQRSVEE